MGMALILNRKGLRYFRDVWDLGRYEFLKWEISRVKFSLAKIYHDFWVKLLDIYGPFRDRMLSLQSAQLTSEEWVSLYRNTEDALPKWVISVGFLKEFNYGLVHFGVEFMSTFPKYTVSSQYFILTEVKPNTKNVTRPTALSGWMSCVRVDRLIRGSA